MNAEVSVALDRIAALESLLACYRIGKHPTEKLHRDLGRTTEAMKAMFGSANPRREGCHSGGEAER